MTPEPADLTRVDEARPLDGQDLPRPATGSIEAPRRTLSLDGAAIHFKVSRRTIYNWIRDGKLQTIRVYGSQRVVLE